jgi:hypothetical protein
MFTFLEKAVQYIRNIFSCEHIWFPVKGKPDWEVCNACCEFRKKTLTHEDCIRIAAENLRDAIDRDILEELYKEAIWDSN